MPLQETSLLIPSFRRPLARERSLGFTTQDPFRWSSAEPPRKAAARSKTYFSSGHLGYQITPSVSEGTVWPAPRPRADAWGYLDRQWIGFHHDSWGHRPIPTAKTSNSQNG